MMVATIECYPFAKNIYKETKKEKNKIKLPKKTHTQLSQFQPPPKPFTSGKLEKTTIVCNYFLVAKSFAPKKCVVALNKLH